tara:strand:+ start:28 stop:411 length:384 start_codon:yes stop_codon:yes gene_type:complete
VWIQWAAGYVSAIFCNFARDKKEELNFNFAFLIFAFLKKLFFFYFVIFAYINKRLTKTPQPHPFTPITVLFSSFTFYYIFSSTSIVDLLIFQKSMNDIHLDMYLAARYGDKPAPILPRLAEQHILVC